MTHSEAVQQMAAEQYLLNELAPEVRDAFEDHVFECQECALDLRMGAAFVDEAKVQLRWLGKAAERPAKARKPQWFSWFGPAFAVPSFALLLILVGYQNLATIPALRRAAAEPAVLPWVSIHTDTRAVAAIPVTADRQRGVALLVDLPQQPSFSTYVFELYDAQGQKVWKSAGSAQEVSGNGALTVFIPAQGLKEGSYSLAVSGTMPSGQATEISRRTLQVSFGN